MVKRIITCQVFALIFSVLMFAGAPVGFSDSDKGTVEQFGPGVFSGEVYRGSFAPDGKTFYFFKKVTPGKEDYRIFESNFSGGKWSRPKWLNLGGSFSDIYPSVSKDGKRLVFSSYRPAPNDTSSKKNAHLWYVNRESDGWSKPIFMTAANKLGYYHSWVEFGWDGNIHFNRVSPDWKSAKNMYSRWNGREYTEPVIFKEVERWKKWNPAVRIVGGSPGPTNDIVFLDVATRDSATGKRASDIWVSFKRNGKWMNPKPLGKEINKDGFDVFPFFSPDKKYMYFVRDFRSFHRVSLVDALDLDGN